MNTHKGQTFSWGHESILQAVEACGKHLDAQEVAFTAASTQKTASTSGRSLTATFTKLIK
jgi:hypothetical protein